MKTSDVESEILESIRSESIKRSSDATKVDTYFYIQSKKFRSNKEVARFLNLLPPKVKSNNNKGIFVEKDHEEIGRCEIEDEPDVWRGVRLWRAKRGNVILDFGKNEFEGIEMDYHFDEVKIKLKDPDGDPIQVRAFRASKVNKENTPRKQNKRKSSEVVRL